MDVLEILRRQAGRFHCPKCGESLADCELEMVGQHDDQSLVKVTCSHCKDARLIAVALATESEPDTVVDEVHDEPIDSLRAAITMDEVLDVKLALANLDSSDLASLLR